MYIDPSVIQKDEINAAVVDLITGARKIPRLILSASDWQVIVLRVLDLLRDDLPSFSLFSELKNGVFTCAGGKGYFDSNKKISDRTKFNDGLTDRIRCVMLARTRARRDDQYDTRSWEELFLTQDGRLMVLKSKNFVVVGPPYRRTDTELSIIHEDNLIDFLRIDVIVSGDFGIHWEWEELLNALLLFCQSNLEKKRETLLKVEKLTYAVERVRELILTGL